MEVLPERIPLLSLLEYLSEVGSFSGRSQVLTCNVFPQLSYSVCLSFDEEVVELASRPTVRVHSENYVDSSVAAGILELQFL